MLLLVFMQDFKNLNRKKKFSLRESLRKPEPRPGNNFKRLAEEPPRSKQRRLRYIIPAIALLLGLIPLVSLLFPSRNAVSGVKESSRKAEAPVAVKDEATPQPLPAAASGKPLSLLDPATSFRAAVDLLPAARPENGRLVSALPDGGQVVYSINDELQERVHRVLEESKVPYGAFVAMDPKTGKVLALTSFSAVAPDWEPKGVYSIYPMASLFKIVTATAALELKKITPDTVLAFRGGLYSESPKYWTAMPRKGGTRIDVTTAMGKSVNPVFGSLASEYVGKDYIVSTAERFGFNQVLFPGEPFLPSKAEVPRTEGELKLMGSGLGREVKISPIHAAAMMAAMANGGAMLTPSLIEEIRGAAGQPIFTHKPRPVRNIVTPETASQVTRMLLTTVSTGTSRKAFHDRRGRPKIPLNIAAKTGSINGKDPEGHYSWFAAYAPADNPRIALAALVINQDKWKIKASYVGEQALETFFNKDR